MAARDLPVYWRTLTSDVRTAEYQEFRLEVGPSLGVSTGTSFWWICRNVNVPTQQQRGSAPNIGEAQMQAVWALDTILSWRRVAGQEKVQTTEDKEGFPNDIRVIHESTSGPDKRALQWTGKNQDDISEFTGKNVRLLMDIAGVYPLFRVGDWVVKTILPNTTPVYVGVPNNEFQVKYLKVRGLE